MGNTVLLFCVFVFGCGQSSLLCGLFSSRREQELLLVAVHVFLIAAAFLAVEHRLKGSQIQQCGSWALES